jgi:hypothetical protein
MELTPTGEEDLDGNILQQIAAWEDGADLREVPLAVQMVAVLEHLKQRNTDFTFAHTGLGLYVNMVNMSMAPSQNHH